MILLLAIYQLAYPLVGLGVLLRLFLQGRGRIISEGKNEIRQRLGRLSPEELAAAGRRPCIWIHAASVGEVSSLPKFLESLARRPGAPPVVISTSTVAGREAAGKLAHCALAVLAPVDFYPAVSEFLDRLKPKALIIVETELWPMTLWLAGARGLPTAVINGRITRRAFGRYSLLKGFFRSVLASISRGAVQTAGDMERFAELGVAKDRLTAEGNLKFDLTAGDQKKTDDCRAAVKSLGWSGLPVFVAASTWPGVEENAVIDAFLAAKRSHPKLRLVLAPRHVERSRESAAALERKGVRYGRWSEAAIASVDCLLLDSMGQLQGFYPLALATFVGGTLAPVGGHNLLEPALAGSPVAFGPHTGSIEAPAMALEMSGGARVHNAEALASWLSQLAADGDHRIESGRLALEAARSFTGATERTLAAVWPLIAA